MLDSACLRGFDKFEVVNTMKPALGDTCLRKPLIGAALSGLCLLAFHGQAVAEEAKPTGIVAISSTNLVADPRYLDIVASFEEAATLGKPSPSSLEQGRMKLRSFTQLAIPAQNFILKAYDAGKASIDPADPKAALKRFQLGANLIGLIQDVETLEGYLEATNFPEGQKLAFAEDSVLFLVARYPGLTAVLSPDLQARFLALDEVVSLRIDRNSVDAQERLKAAVDASASLDELNAKLDALLQGIEAAGP